VLGGGFGVVYVAYDHEFRRKLAIKTFRDVNTIAIDQAAFTRESTAWIRLDHHPNVVQAYFALNLSERPHLFLEYVSGGSLRQWTAETRGRGAIRDGLRLAIEACDGLSHIYARGITAHRDIKPDNFLLSGDGHLKVSDLGLASLHTPDRLVPVGGVHTLAGGTPAYMPPEQFFEGRVDMCADIYAFGIVLFEILTGRHPFADWFGRLTNLSQWAELHRTVPPDLKRAGLSKRLTKMLERCLAKDVRERYSTFEPVRTVSAGEK
jgi:serine/threonine-protein kinase